MVRAWPCSTVSSDDSFTWIFLSVFRFSDDLRVLSLVRCAEEDRACVTVSLMEPLAPTLNADSDSEAFPLTFQLFVCEDDLVTFSTSRSAIVLSVDSVRSTSSTVSRSNRFRCVLRIERARVSPGARATEADRAPRSGVS
jgi:hypothetical protein